MLEQESRSVQETNLRNLPDLKIGESITISQFEVATSSMPNESIIFDNNLTPVNTQPPSELIDADKVTLTGQVQLIIDNSDACPILFRQNTNTRGTGERPL